MLYSRLSTLKHANGVPICHIYKAPGSAYGNTKNQGATVTFNVRTNDGAWMGGWKVGALLRANNIHVRTGSLCNPAGMANALGISATDLRAAFTSGFRCNQEADVRGDVPFGMVRVTFGAMSTCKDIEALMDVMQQYFVDCDSSKYSTYQGRLSPPVAGGVSEKLAIGQGSASGDAKREGNPTVPRGKRSAWKDLCACLPSSR
jgi:molybdenum cofactor sulfurtransferase